MKEVLKSYISDYIQDEVINFQLTISVKSLQFESFAIKNASSNASTDLICLTVMYPLLGVYVHVAEEETNFFFINVVYRFIEHPNCHVIEESNEEKIIDNKAKIRN